MKVFGTTKKKLTDLDIEGIYLVFQVKWINKGLSIAISTMQENETAWFKILPKRHFFPEGSELEEFETSEKLVIKSDEPLMFKIHVNSI